jgi:hypothetical protein
LPSLVLIEFMVSVWGAVKVRGFPSKHQPALNYIALSCMYDIYYLFRHTTTVIMTIKVNQTKKYKKLKCPILES